jgi:hypothetical protein
VARSRRDFRGQRWIQATQTDYARHIAIQSFYIEFAMLDWFAKIFAERDSRRYIERNWVHFQ